MFIYISIYIYIYRYECLHHGFQKCALDDIGLVAQELCQDLALEDVVRVPSKIILCDVRQLPEEGMRRVAWLGLG